MQLFFIHVRTFLAQFVRLMVLQEEEEEEIIKVDRSKIDRYFIRKRER